MKTNLFYLLWLAIIGLSPLGGKSVIAVDTIECINVISDDSVHISLSSSISSELYIAIPFGGPYTELVNPTSIDGGTIVLIGNLINQSNILWYYFFDPLNNSYSDTLSNIVLDLEPLNGGGIASLSWNHPYASTYNLPNGQDFHYTVHRETTIPGIYEEIAAVPFNTNVYKDTISHCDAFLNYYVSFDIGNSCDYNSNIKGDFFNNNTPPDIPEIIQVSVDTAIGFTVLDWAIPPQSDVQGYVIVQNVGGFSVAIDTIWDPSVSSYVDINSDVTSAIYSYGIAAFDTCINPNSNPSFFYISPPTALNDFQNSILLENEYFGCDQINELKWNSYKNWPDGVFRYELYVSQNDGPYSLLANISPNDSSYIHNNLIAFDSYCYIIKAIDLSQTRFSLSNILCQEIVYPGLPDVFYLTSTQCDSAKNVTLEFYLESDEEIVIQGFIIQALYPNTEQYENIGFIDYVPQNLIYFIDEDSPSDIGSIWYRIQILDGCGNENFVSNELNTPFISVVTDDYNAVNTIVWNEVEGRAGQLGGYRLHRVHNEGNDVIVYTSGAEEYYYEDNLSEEWQKEGDYCYYIETIENENPYGDFSESISFENCTQINPRVWIPNSFIIGGGSGYFMPVFAYAGVEDYRMTIMNRWGKVLFETNDIYKGWDGIYKGNPVKQDVYIYIIQLKDGFGKLITETGSVTVFSY